VGNSVAPNFVQWYSLMEAKPEGNGRSRISLS